MLSGCTGQPGTFTTGKTGLGFPIPAEVVAQSHCACGISLHGMDAAVSRAGPTSNHSGRFRRESINPLVSRNRLTSLRIGPHRRPVTLLLDFLVRHRALKYEDERLELAGFGIVPVFHEIVADFISQDRVMKVHLRQTGNRAQDNVFYTWQRGGSYGHRISVASQTGRHPDDMNFFNVRRTIGHDHAGVFIVLSPAFT